MKEKLEEYSKWREKPVQRALAWNNLSAFEEYFYDWSGVGEGRMVRDKWGHITEGFVNSW